MLYKLYCQDNHNNNSYSWNGAENKWYLRGTWPINNSMFRLQSMDELYRALYHTWDAKKNDMPWGYKK